MEHYLSIAELFGYEPSRLWILFWVLFFVRIVLGFAVGIDDIAHGFRALKNEPAKHAAEARSLWRANLIVTGLHVMMLVAIALAAPYIPSSARHLF